MPKRVLEESNDNKDIKKSKSKKDDSSSSSSSSSSSESDSSDSDSDNNNEKDELAAGEKNSGKNSQLSIGNHRQFGIGATTEAEADQGEPEEIEKTEFKVFVSRIPPQWGTPKIKEHFTLLFGEVVSVDIFGPGKEEKAEIRKENRKTMCYAFLKGECTRGEWCEFSHEVTSGGAGHGKGAGQKGVIYFRTQQSVDRALSKGTIHISSRNLRILAYQSTEDGRDTSTCYAWANFNCTRGTECIFAHDGPGGCVKVSAPGEGRAFVGRPCLSFKTKGKCSKGDTCTFQHISREKASIVNTHTVFEKDDAKADAGDETTRVSKPKEPAKPSAAGICDNFRKTGRCRKGDRCKYEHPASFATKFVSAATEAAEEPKKGKSTKKLRFNKDKFKAK